MRYESPEPMKDSNTTPPSTRLSQNRLGGRHVFRNGTLQVVKTSTTRNESWNLGDDESKGVRDNIEGAREFLTRRQGKQTPHIFFSSIVLTLLLRLEVA